MATGRIPTTANSPLTAKGDLFTFSTGSAKLAVGSDGDTLVADSATATGLRYNPTSAAGKNVFINGGMDIWQRGTSFTGTTTAFCADRWQAYRATTGSTFSRQVTNDTTNLSFIQYCTRVSRDSGNTSTTSLYFFQNVETVNAIPFAGKAVTLSFYARRGANYSAASNALAVSVITGTGTDQNIGGGYTGQATAFSGTATLTTTWQRFSFTGTIAATATEFVPFFDFVPVGTAGAADFYEITGVQLEVGSVSTSFSRAQGTIQGELAACQRYYYRQTGSGNTATYNLGTAYSTTKAFVNIIHPVSMRIVPTAIEVPSTITHLKLTNIAANNYTISAIAFVEGTYTNTILEVTASGMTTNQGVWIGNNSTTAGFIGVSAEL